MAWGATNRHKKSRAGSKIGKKFWRLERITELFFPLSQSRHEGLNLRAVPFEEGQSGQNGNAHSESECPPRPHVLDRAGRVPNHAHQGEQSENRAQVQKRTNL